jgi:hypothetical protein
MSSLMYTEFKRANMSAEIDLSSDDIRAKLLMSNTTADTENAGVVNVADFTTLDAADSTGYADVALANLAVTKIDGSNRAKFASDTVVFAGLSGDATRDYQGMLLYKHVDGNPANDLVVSYVHFAATIPKEATQVTVPVPANGWMYKS